MGRKNGKIHVQINSLEALERLIGENPEFEFDIRQNIVQKFAEKHLKSVANSEIMKTAEKEIKKHIWTQKGYNTVIHPKLKSAIESEIKETYNKILNESFKKLKNEHVKLINAKFREFEEETLNKITEKITKKLSEKYLNQMVDTMVNSKIQRMLKLIAADKNGTVKIDSIDQL